MFEILEHLLYTISILASLPILWLMYVFIQDDIDDTAVLKDVTFAPRDITPIHLSAKDNTHGLGYRGLNPQRALPSTHINLFEPPAITKKGRKGIRGQVSCFNQ